MHASGLSAPPRLARFAALAGVLLIAHAAPGQTISPTFRTGTSYAACGDLYTGPRATHPYNTPVYVHDAVSFTDDGAGYRPDSSADFTYDSFLSASSISLVVAGHSYRGPIPASGNGSASAASSTQDQWSFYISAPTCFSFDGSVEVFLSTGALTTSQGFQMGIDGGGAGIYLADGSYTGLLSAYVNSTGSASRHYSGTLTPGSYFMTISGAAEGNGNPRTASYTTHVSLTIGPPPLITSPAPASTCADGIASFTVEPLPPGSTTQWQLQRGTEWVDLVEGVNTINGAPAFDITGARTPTVGVRSIWGLGGNLRCIISNDCGSSTTDPATLTILDPSDPSCGGAPACDPDLNQDGNVDQGDVDFLVNVAAGGDNTSGIDPDFNHDGNIDQGDIDALVNVVAGGNCP